MSIKTLLMGAAGSATAASMRAFRLSYTGAPADTEMHMSVSDGTNVFTSGYGPDALMKNAALVKIDVMTPQVLSGSVVDQQTTSKGWFNNLVLYSGNIYTVGRFYNSTAYTSPDSTSMAVFYKFDTNCNVVFKKNIYWSNTYTEDVGINNRHALSVDDSGVFYMGFSTRVGTTEDAVGFVKLTNLGAVTLAASVTPISNVYGNNVKSAVQPNGLSIILSSYSSSDGYSARIMAFNTSTRAFQTGSKYTTAGGQCLITSLLPSNTEVYFAATVNSATTKSVAVFKATNAALNTDPTVLVQYEYLDAGYLFKATNGDYILYGMSQTAGGVNDGAYVMRFSSSFALIYQRKLTWNTNPPNPALATVSCFEHGGKLWVSLAHGSSTYGAVFLELPGDTGEGTGVADIYTYAPYTFASINIPVTRTSITLTSTSRTFTSSSVTTADNPIAVSAFSLVPKHWLSKLNNVGEVWSLCNDTQDNVYIAGATAEGYVSKMDPAGNIIWQKSLVGTQAIYGVVNDSAGNVYVTGRVSTPEVCAFVAKYSFDGILQWQKTLNTVGETDSGFSIAIDSTNSNLYVVGYSYISSVSKGFLVKISVAGVLQWQKVLSVASTLSSVAVSATDAVYVVGNVESTNYTGYLAKFTSAGAITWQRSLGGTGRDFFNHCALDALENVYIVGDTNTIGAGSDDGLIVKYNSAGTLQWQRIIGGAGIETGRGICVNSGGCVTLIGVTNSQGAGLFDTYLARYSPNGTLIWQRTIGATTENFAYGTKVCETRSGYLYFNVPSSSNPYIAKLPVNGLKQGTYDSQVYATATLTEATGSLTGTTPTATVSSGALVISDSSFTDTALSYSTTAINIP